MSWHTVTLTGPPTYNMVPAWMVYQEIAEQLDAHPSGNWTEIYSRVSPLDPEYHVWQCSVPGLTFYVCFSWRALAPEALNITLAEAWIEPVLMTIAYTQYASTVTINSPGAVDSSWNLGSLGMPTSTQAVTMGADTNATAWLTVGVTGDGLHLSYAKTLNSTSPQVVFVGTFDTLVSNPALTEVPVILRSNINAYSSMYGYVTRYPTTSQIISLIRAEYAPFTNYVGGTLLSTTTESALTGVIASREMIRHTAISGGMNTGQLRGLSRHTLVTQNAATGIYQNDRLIINDRVFAWTGAYWFDMTV